MIEFIAGALIGGFLLCVGLLLGWRMGSGKPPLSFQRHINAIGSYRNRERGPIK